MTWLLAVTWLKSRAVALFGWIRANPLLAVIIGLCLALAWTWHGKRQALDQLAQHIAAEKAATGAQRRVNNAATVYYKEKADVADTNHTDMVAEAFDATAAYVASHRVQPADRTCKAAPAASGDDTQVPPEPTPSAVVVAQADVETCAADFSYARSAFEWAQSLKLPNNPVPDGTTDSSVH